ncbi:hypothetical protein SNARM312S_04644 [Streptomyces narbonensis]
MRFREQPGRAGRAVLRVDLGELGVEVVVADDEGELGGDTAADAVPALPAVRACAVVRGVRAVREEQAGRGAAALFGGPGVGAADRPDPHGREG